LKLLSWTELQDTVKKERKLISSSGSRTITFVVLHSLHVAAAREHEAVPAAAFKRASVFVT
jgi:hypothetical protein